MGVTIRIQEDDFDTGVETRSLSVLGTGGICTFTGVVRNENDDENVRWLRLEHYPGMTEKQIAEIIQEAEGRWPMNAATVIHRVGDLYPSDQIVFVGVACAHRGDAFDACEFIMDYLKTRATFWKKEFTAEGERWLETRRSDVDTADNWTR